MPVLRYDALVPSNPCGRGRTEVKARLEREGTAEKVPKYGRCRGAETAGVPLDYITCNLKNVPQGIAEQFSVVPPRQAACRLAVPGWRWGDRQEMPVFTPRTCTDLA